MAKDNFEYFLLDIPLTSESAVVLDSPDLDEPFDDCWDEGIKLEEGVPEPLVYTFKPGHIHSYYDATYPIMSDELLNALTRYGVNNIDVYESIIHQQGSDVPITNFKTVNVIGLVSALDEDESDAESLGMGEGPMSPRFFKKLKISSEKAHGLLLFRLAEKVSEIVIHRTIKEKLEKNFVDLEFVPA